MWQRLTSRLVTALFADKILGGQKRFVSNVAHELRTPLSIIKTTSEVALLDPALSREARRSFVEIVQELNRASEILNNLVTLNSLENPARMAVQNLDLGPIVDDAVKKLRALARERGVRVRVRTAVGSIAVGNRAALEVVAYNIIKNAIAFTPADRGGSVVVHTAAAGSSVTITVEDEGVGMTPEELSHIFEPFYRADTSRNRAISQSGSGLGLTIAQELVRAHGGAVRMSSKKRRGTTVVVTLPRGGFIPATPTQEYHTERGALTEHGKDGAPEPHSGRRYFIDGRVVSKGIAGT